MKKRDELIGCYDVDLFDAAAFAPSDRAKVQGCLGKAQMDEPLFILRAHDPLATKTVRAWAEFARGHGVRWEKVEAAMALALEMEEWQRDNPELMAYGAKEKK